jgi:hypothetical protein
MKINSDRVLLYIEPKNVDKNVVIDEFSIKVFNALVPIIFNHSKNLKNPNIGSIGYHKRKPVFNQGLISMGHHECVCGAHSSAYDILLDDGKNQIITNYLALHYLVCHRSEVPKEEIEKIRKLNFSITLSGNYEDRFNLLAQYPTSISEI